MDWTLYFAINLHRFRRMAYDEFDENGVEQNAQNEGCPTSQI